ncbi:MAG TPA: HPr family phosphocarrier protein [Anaerolineales bacterium]|nr:HPr family phosphocarrier protein [Anaerolineales bacterium]
MAEITVTIRNKVGLHARPAALFVKEANKYKSTITVSKNEGSKEVNAKSILGILGLGVDFGAVIRIRAEGDDADNALLAFQALVDRNFGEKE